MQYEIIQALHSLVIPGDTIEIRTLGQQGEAISRFFSDMEQAAHYAANVDGTVKGVYVTLNPIASAAKPEKGAKDEHIARRVNLGIDFDPIRPADVSSTDEEHTAAIERARACRNFLSERGWPEPILADSGNGAHLVYGIELPNDEQAKELLRLVLMAVEARFSDDVVNVDRKVFNASRIWKLYGTTACKGKATSDRPHRKSQMLELPELFQLVSETLLRELAAEARVKQSAPLVGTVMLTQGDNRDLSPYVKAAVKSEIQRVSSAVNGTRNNTLNEAAFALGTLVGTGELDEGDAVRELLNAANQNGIPAREASRTITSGLAAGKGKPRNLSTVRTSQRAHSDVQVQDSVASFEEEAVMAEAGCKLSRSDVWACFNEGEYGDAKLLVALFNGRLAYDHSQKAWYTWTDTVWTEDRTGAIRKLIAGHVAAEYLHHSAEMLKEAELMPDEDKERKKASIAQADALSGRAKALRSLKRCTSVSTFAQSLAGIDGSEWDICPMRLPVANGMLDLRTGDLVPMKPTDYIRTVAPTEWRGPNEPCPRFEQFMAEIFADKADTADIVGFVQRLLGYGLTGTSKEHVFPVLCGDQGRNGKDTLLKYGVENVLGELAGPVSNDVLIESKGRAAGVAQPHLCSLQGKRIVWASETSEGARLNAAQVKWVTGGGTIKARQLYGKEFDFSPTHLMLVITNFKPHASSDDMALWDRVKLVSFDTRFVDRPAKENERPRDPSLGKTLEEERSGILAWLVRGCLAWQQQGLNPPKSVAAATDDYRNSEDTLAMFIDERCHIEEGRKTGSQLLYDNYKEWASNGGMKPLSLPKFVEKMKRLFTKQETKTGNFFLGISL